MRLLTVLFVVAVVASACAGDDSQTRTESTADATGDDRSSADETGTAEEDQMSSTTPDASADEPTSTTGQPSTTTETPTTTTTTEPPSTTLQLNPTTTKASPSPSTTGPVGGGAAEFPGQIEPALAGFVDQAKADLAGVLGVDAATITEVSSVLVTWPDAAIGCPEPDMQYIQLPEDGALIELEVGGTVYRYHSGGDRTAPFLCPAARATSPTTK